VAFCARKALGAGRWALGVPMPMRARRAVWTDIDLALLKYLMWLAEPDKVDCHKVAHLFQTHSLQDIQKRCACIRDLERRRERRRILNEQHVGSTEEPDSPTSVIALPPAGRLHPALVWVPSTGEEIGPMNLGT